MSSVSFPVPAFLKRQLEGLLVPQETLDSLFEKFDYVVNPSLDNSFWSEKENVSHISKSAKLGGLDAFFPNANKPKDKNLSNDVSFDTGCYSNHKKKKSYKKKRVSFANECDSSLDVNIEYDPKCDNFNESMCHSTGEEPLSSETSEVSHKGCDSSANVCYNTPNTLKHTPVKSKHNSRDRKNSQLSRSKDKFSGSEDLEEAHNNKSKKTFKTAKMQETYKNSDAKDRSSNNLTSSIKLDDVNMKRVRDETVLLPEEDNIPLYKSKENVSNSEHLVEAHNNKYKKTYKTVKTQETYKNSYVKDRSSNNLTSSIKLDDVNMKSVRDETVLLPEEDDVPHYKSKENVSNSEHLVEAHNNKCKKTYKTVKMQETYNNSDVKGRTSINLNSSIKLDEVNTKRVRDETILSDEDIIPPTQELSPPLRKHPRTSISKSKNLSLTFDCTNEISKASVQNIAYLKLQNTKDHILFDVNECILEDNSNSFKKVSPAVKGKRDLLMKDHSKLTAVDSCDDVSDMSTLTSPKRVKKRKRTSQGDVSIEHSSDLQSKCSAISPIKKNKQSKEDVSVEQSRDLNSIYSAVSPIKKNKQSKKDVYMEQSSDLKSKSAVSPIKKNKQSKQDVSIEHSSDLKSPSFDVSPIKKNKQSKKDEMDLDLILKVEDEFDESLGQYILSSDTGTADPTIIQVKEDPELIIPIGCN